MIIRIRKLTFIRFKILRFLEHGLSPKSLMERKIVVFNKVCYKTINSIINHEICRKFHKNLY